MYPKEQTLNHVVVGQEKPFSTLVKLKFRISRILELGIFGLDGYKKVFQFCTDLTTTTDFGTHLVHIHSFFYSQAF
ncbi:hypothetical protein SYK_05060 [Pseudodesulfovibrio nedwellii]|uniref:Uncharacterized protein n=1 Tax=Pseudodesulfovibrio nedwellii TaxID=2973072 RepID=A0ABN6RYX2_9BACT|nr:hypothetical protein SYK_05060 [Pseudodesulfovibrio nedwellii]